MNKKVWSKKHTRFGHLNGKISACHRYNTCLLIDDSRQVHQDCSRAGVVVFHVDQERPPRGEVVYPPNLNMPGSDESHYTFNSFEKAVQQCIRTIQTGDILLKINRQEKHAKYLPAGIATRNRRAIEYGEAIPDPTRVTNVAYSPLVDNEGPVERQWRLDHPRRALPPVTGLTSSAAR